MSEPGATAGGGRADAPRSICLVGAGKMGGAMLEGWLAAGTVPAGSAVIEPYPSAALKDRAGRGEIRLNPSTENLPPPELLVLGIKPQSLEGAAPAIRHLAGPETLLVSILAGKTVGDLAAAFPEVRAVVRAMPNLPASIGRGAIGIYANPAATGRHRAVAAALLSANGVVEWVDREELIDAVTALSGSGPAYLFHLVEAMAEAGAAAGLPAGLAARLAQATVIGAAALLDGSGLPPAELRENVTSPAGTTAAALAVLMAPDGLGALMTRTVAAAKRRAGELSG